MARKVVNTEEMLKRVELLSTLTRTPLRVVMGNDGLQLQREDTLELLGPRGRKSDVAYYVQAMIDGVVMYEPAVLASDTLTQEDLDHLLQQALAEAAAEATPAPSAFDKRPPKPLVPYTEPAQGVLPLVPDQAAIDELDALLDGIQDLDITRGISD